MTSRQHKKSELASKKVRSAKTRKAKLSAENVVEVPEATSLANSDGQSVQVSGEEIARLIDDQNRLSEFSSRVEIISGKNSSLEKDILKLQRNLHEAHARIDEIRSSTSWRLTAPLRHMSVGASRAKRRTWELSYSLYRRLPFPVSTRMKLREIFRPFFFPLEPSAPISKRISNVIYSSETASYLSEQISIKEDRIFRRILAKVYAHESTHGQVEFVFAVPLIARGGAELVVANYVKYINQVVKKKSVLIISTDMPGRPGAWDFPENVCIVELLDYFPESTRNQRSRILFRFLSPRPGIRFHIVNSDSAWALVKDYGARLTSSAKVFASCFALQFDPVSGKKTGYAEFYLKECARFLSGILTDNERFSKDATAHYVSESASRRIHVLYNPVREAPARQSAAKFGGPGRSVLWAGRLDEEKRVDLLLEIARRATDVDFHVFGSAVVGREMLPSAAQLSKLKNVHLHGAFADLSDLSHKGPYSAFFFTSRWEGMPNILLEVASLGIPIVAPAVGGVPEIINEKTGYLLAENPTANDYLSALDAICKEPDVAVRKTKAIADLIKQRHSWKSFFNQMKKIDGYAG